MDFIKQYKKQIIIIILLLLGILIGLHLVQTPQIFKSRATQELYNTFQLNQTSDEGATKPVTCGNTENGYTCTTESLDVNLKVDVLELEKLSQE